MGGAMSMYYGYQRGMELAGIFAMSSFLDTKSKVYEVSLENAVLFSSFDCHTRTLYI